jgi:hypothetical protein
MNVQNYDTTIESDAFAKGMHAHAVALKILSQYPYCDFTTDFVGWVYFLNVPLSNEIFTLALNFRNRKQNIPTRVRKVTVHLGYGT